MLELRGKSALIVGAKRVGRVVAERLADEGVNLAISYRRSLAEAQSLYETVKPRVERSCLVQGDLASEADVRRIVAEARSALGGLWFVVNLASDFPRTPLEALDERAWEASMSFAKGSYLLSVHAARLMRANPGPTRGHIVLFGDCAVGDTPYAGYLPYLTSKAAIEFMARAFAVELAPDRILVNAVAPGPTLRPEEISARAWNLEDIAGTPLRRQSSARDIAEIVVTLLRSETITGERIRVDSGWHLAGPGSGS